MQALVLNAAMQTIPGTKIVQHATSLQAAIDAGLADPAWWGARHGARDLYIYTFDGIVGGMIIGEPADFVTLAEFAASVEEGTEQMWAELKMDMDWL